MAWAKGRRRKVIPLAAGLTLVQLVFISPAFAGSTSDAESPALQEALCLSSDLSFDIQFACSAKKAGSSGSCPSDCAKYLSQATQDCIDTVAATFEARDKRVLTACNADKAGRPPDAPPAPVDFPTFPAAAATIGDFSANAPGLTTAALEATCLDEGANANVSPEVRQACTDLVATAGSGSDGNDDLDISCPRTCSQALNKISADCIQQLADAATFGSTFRQIFDACNTSDSSDWAAGAPGSDDAALSPQQRSPTRRRPTAARRPPPPVSAASQPPASGPSGGGSGAATPQSAAAAAPQPAANAPAPANQHASHKVVATTWVGAAMAAAAFGLCL